MITLGKWMSWDEFLKNWGKDTLKLTQKVSDKVKRREVEELINMIRNTARKYGYGPAKVLAVLFEKIT